MGWRGDWPERVARPKVRKLSQEDKDKLLKSMNNAINNSPVLTALNYRIRCLRGRFYYERVYSSEAVETIARVTPLTTNNDLLLEVERGRNSWSTVVEGSIKQVTIAISGDKKGNFHGLGVLDKSIRRAHKEKLERLPVERKALTFHYKDSEATCSVQEILYHFFELPISVISEPSEWYAYHRTPYIKEINVKNDKILVTFSSYSINGGNFGGTCLYMKKEDEWCAFTIKPNQSDSIESSLIWLEKRKLKSW
jgi:hypothetical protein